MFLKGSWLNVLSTALKGHSDISSLYSDGRAANRQEQEGPCQEQQEREVRMRVCINTLEYLIL